MARTKDMTSGNPTWLILSFCMPMILSNLLQQVYSLVDTLVIGRVEGVAALTAISASGWLDWMMLSFAMGMTQGFGIQIAQYFGARQEKSLKRAVGQSILLCVLIFICLEIIAQGMLTGLLELLHTPEQIFSMTRMYLRIIFGALPIIIAYNLLSSLLRAVGDSRTPLIAVVVSTVLNIGLDILFVAVFRWGVAGAAGATVCSQTLSCLICLVVVCRLPMMQIVKEDLYPDKGMSLRLVKLGLPIALQNCIISMGGLVLQRVVNSFDFVFVAGYNAASRLQGLIETAGASLGNAVGTYAGQNCGAGRFDRVRTGLRRSAQIGVVTALCIGGAMILGGRQLLHLFVQDDPAMVEQVITYGYRFLIVMSSGLSSLYLLFVYRSTLQGIGDTLIPMASGFVELVMRIGCALLLPAIIGEWGVYLSEIMAWIGAMVLLIIGYYYRIGKLEKRAA